MIIDFQKSGGLVPAIAQDAATGQVLMLAWMNQEAFEETLRTRRAVYFSRSRQRLCARVRNRATYRTSRKFSSIVTPIRSC